MVKLKDGDQVNIKPDAGTYSYFSILRIPKEVSDQPWFVKRKGGCSNEGASLVTNYNGVEYDVFFYNHEIVPKSLEELMEDYLCSK